MKAAYADEDYYCNEYLRGKNPILPDESVSYYIGKASHQIDRYTYGRLRAGREVTEEVKDCCCELAEYLYSCDRQKEQTGGLKSYSNDGESGTFDTESYTEKEKAAKIRSVIREYLAETGLLYQGIYPDE